MKKIAELKILSEDEAGAAYLKAEEAVTARINAWQQAQEAFLSENPNCRNNAAFASAVNKIIATEESAKMTDREVLEAAFVRVYLA
jgi:hypothetical protein